MALDLAVDEQTVGRAIDTSILDIDPRVIHESMQILDRGAFLGRGNVNAGKQNGCVPAFAGHHDGVAVRHMDDMGHWNHCKEKQQ